MPPGGVFYLLERRPKFKNYYDGIIIGSSMCSSNDNDDDDNDDDDDGDDNKGVDIPVQVKETAALIQPPKKKDLLQQVMIPVSPVGFIGFFLILV